MNEQPDARVLHPSLEVLQAFGRGEGDEGLFESIESHLADCPGCQKLLEDSSGSSDDLIELLRNAEEDAGSDARSPRRFPVEGGYELGEIIGRGGMGVVYKARQVGLDRVVALKMIAAGKDASPQMLDRFRKEVEAAAGLNHPSITQIYDVGVRDGTPYYTMEFLEGGALADRLLDGPMLANDAARLIERLARAAEHAHRNGVIHRDLKPANILFTSEGLPKLADFGLAKRLESTGGEATRSDMLVGTPSYMSPEQAEGNVASVGVASDVYALGAILYECLVGRPPFVGKNPLDTLELIRSTDPISPTRLRPSVPSDLETICLTCLEKQPARRYPSAIALADELGRYLRGEPILARPSSRIDRVMKWARRRPSEAAFGALLILSLFGTIAGLLIHQSRLRAALHQVELAAREAGRQREAAESNYREARSAIGQVLDALSKREFTGISRLGEIREAQSEAALSFYDKILERVESSDPRVREDLAAAAVEAASVQIGLGRAGPATANLDRARSLYASLLEKDPTNPSLLRGQMTAHIKLGVMLMNLDAKRSVEVLEQARDLAIRKRSAHPDQAMEVEDVAWCEHNIGSAWQIAGRNDLAIPYYERAVELNEVAKKHRPDNIGLRVELAENLVNLGLARWNTGGADQAESCYRRADVLLTEALAADPEPPAYILSRCDLLVNWGNLAVARGDVRLGIARFDEGVNRIEPLLEREPNHERTRATSLNLRGARALALEKEGRLQEAAADWQRVIALEPDGPRRRSFRVNRLLLLVRAGETGAIRSESSDLERAPDLQGVDRYNLACALALASKVAKENSPERAQLREDAMRLLGQAFKAAPALRETAKNDADLAPLKDDERFKQYLGDQP